METTATTPSLKARYKEFQSLNPTVRIRDAAKKLDTTEAELLALSVGETVTKLEGNWPDLLKRLPELGYVMSLTRNEACVLEHKAAFEQIDIIDAGPHKMATVIGKIETRVFFAAWKYGFAQTVQSEKGTQKSLQFFDASGEAITKIYLQGEKSNEKAYDVIVNDFKAATQTSALEITPNVAPQYATEVDIEAFRAAWAAMKDTHEFFGLLRKFKANRLDAMRWAGEEYCTGFHKSKLQYLLETIAKSELPIMIFAGNKGNLQIHQGPVRTIRVMDKWLNVLDPEFNMHLNMDLIESCWIVKKPTADGIVTGLECFDAAGEMMVQFFGLRKPGKPELEDWRALVKQIG